MLKNLKERKLHLLILTFLTGLFFGVNLSNLSNAKENVHKYLDYFHQVYQIVRTDYVEVPNNKEIFYGAIKGVIKSLNDPYSRFLDEKAFSSFKEETTGKFVGVGIEITLRDGEVVVISPIEDTPAMNAGIISEDVITKIDNIPIKDMDLSEIVRMIKGHPHTRVELTIRRENFEEPLVFDLERVPIKIKTVNYAALENYKIGYLKVKLFSSDTQRDVEKALKFFNKKNIDKIIIDLRWNPGGLLDKAIKISDLFLDSGDLIVSTKGRESAENISEFKSITNPLFKGELIVLVNKGSASASEIFSGAIQDNQRGKLLGEKTFGKGSVQKFFNLDDEIGVTITIAKYYTPSGASIHGKGIIPDYQVTSDKIPDLDKKNVNTILKERLLESFVKKHKIYNEENRKKFIEFLNEKNLPISPRSASFLLKREINRFVKRPLYDLEFDNQLKTAVEIISGKQPKDISGS